MMFGAVRCVFALSFLFICMSPPGNQISGCKRTEMDHLDLPDGADHLLPEIFSVFVHTHITSPVPEPIHQALIAEPCQPPAPGSQA